jgi:hypothetical protein
MSVLKANLLVTPQELYTSSSTQGTDIGALATTGDSRYFRYALAGGTTLVPGTLQASSAQDQTNLTPAGGLSIAAAAVGATTVTTTSTVTLTANQAAGGTLHVVLANGASYVGYTYKIKSHPAATAAVVTFTLEDPIQIALTTSSKVVVLPNPYNGVIINPATVSGMPVGVPLYAVVNAQYGWIQTHGVVSCLIGAADITVGKSLMPSAATAGALIVGTGVFAPVGYTIVGTKTTESDPIFLTID